MKEPGNVSMDTGEDTPHLSKRQQKKRAKHANWLKFRNLKRAKEKDQKKKRKLESVGMGLPQGPSRKQLKATTMAESPCQIRIAIDLSFENLMTDRDVKKTLKQVQHCYASNRRTAAPLQLFLTSVDGSVQQQMESIQGTMKWDVHFRREHCSQVFEKEQIVYLTSESPNVLSQLEDDKAYVIGGLVDHNHHKGLCHRLALEGGMNHARLPIDEFVKMESRRILAINHVFQILVKWTESRCWKDAFLSVLPARKGVTPKPSKVEPNLNNNCDSASGAIDDEEQRKTE